MRKKVFGVLHLFCGIGGGALGFEAAKVHWKGQDCRFRTLGGVDVDPAACEDFETLTGSRATQMDLFTREDYCAFHGHEPPADWREATGADIRAASHGIRPDVIFGSPPCKGFSGLLSSAAAASPKYEAMNRLAVRGVELVMEAWPDDPPGLFIMENVPRITSRGKHLLELIEELLRFHGYKIHKGTHDMGEVGELSQHRRRFLLVARQPKKVPTYLYRPVIKQVRSIGERLAPVPMPDDIAGGPMHRLPRLTWLTWVRLALIPAGGDWRDLQGIEPGSFAIEPGRTPFNHVYRVTSWDDPAGAVTSSRDQGIADPRLPVALDKGFYHGSYGVQPWDQASGTVTGGPTSGSKACVADPRLGHEPRKGVFRVADWELPATTIIGAASVRGSNGMAAVADPRVKGNRGKTYNGSPGLMGVMDWEEPASTVTGGARATSSNTPAAVADPRIGHTPRDGAYEVSDWHKAARTVTGQAGVGVSNGVAAVADPRLTCNPRSGAFQVTAWQDPASTVTASGDVHAQGASAVADPRLPDAQESGAWLIVSQDGTWHRPLTTYELALLQGFPTHMPDGSPLHLAGKAQGRWRERIGNAVPPPAAEAVAELMLMTLATSEAKSWQMALWTSPVWVAISKEALHLVKRLKTRLNAGTGLPSGQVVEIRLEEVIR